MSTTDLASHADARSSNATRGVVAFVASIALTTVSLIALASVVNVWS